MATGCNLVFFELKSFAIRSAIPENSTLAPKSVS